MAEALLTIPKAAELFGVSRSTMWRWVKTDQIRTAKTAGGHYRIYRKDLELFIDQNNLAPKMRGTSGNPRILVVDDDPYIKKLLKKAFDNNTYDIEYASDGFEAGKKIMTFNPHIVILDLYMPRMSGFDVCKLIKQDPQTSHIKIIAISGAEENENKTAILNAGADLFLPKPLDIKKIQIEVAGILKYKLSF